MRTVRRPLRRATDSAERLAAGDLSARMGVSGPEELARLGRAFDGMAEELEQADLQQRRFLADLTHEIATPLSAVTGFAVALVDGSAQTEEERSEAAEVIVRESRRLDQLLAGARTLQQLDLFATCDPQPVQLDRLCREAAQRFHRSARLAGVELEVDTTPVSASADVRLVEIVVDNFMSNALRHTAPGGRVVLSASRSSGTVAVAVRDDGEGIAAEHLARIFDRLYRVESDRDRDTGGSGLGLAIARRAAEAMGAHLEVQSTPGAGSEFRLCFAASTSGGRHPPAGDAPKQVGAPPKGYQPHLAPPNPKR